MSELHTPHGTDRAVFLQRLRERIASGDHEPRHPYVALPDGPPRPAFRGGPAGLPGFRRAWTALGGHTHEASSVPEVAACIVRAVDGRGPVVVDTDQLLPSIEGSRRWSEQELSSLPDAAVGVVRATAAIAATGSIVIDSTATSARSLSLLPDVAVFVVPSDAIVATPSDILRDHARHWPQGPPSQVVLVSGPSRSADIEMTLTVGVHGPGEVHVVIVST